MKTRAPSATWTVREAKSKLSEVFRRAHKQGPQYIGKRGQTVVVSREQWESQAESKPDLRVWRSANAPEDDFVPPRSRNPNRPIPFSDLDF